MSPLALFAFVPMPRIVPLGSITLGGGRVKANRFASARFIASLLLELLDAGPQFAEDLAERASKRTLEGAPG
jgi:hypothetical protein